MTIVITLQLCKILSNCNDSTPRPRIIGTCYFIYNKCHASFSTIKLLNQTHSSPFDSSSSICSIHFTDYHVTCGFSLENQEQDTESPDSIFTDFFLDLCSLWLSKIYKKITNEKKDPKGSYAINHIDPYRKALINKYIIYNTMKQSEKLFSTMMVCHLADAQNRCTDFWQMHGTDLQMCKIEVTADGSAIQGQGPWDLTNKLLMKS